MPILATGNNRRRAREAGFSLVELMVVIFLMGLISGVVALTLPPQMSAAEREAQRLAARLHLAMEDAVMTGDALGFGANARGYGFFRLRRGQWRQIEDDRMFGAQDWEPGVSAIIETRGFTLEPDGAEDLRPVIRFDPLGGATPFAIVLRQERSTLRIVGDAGGAVRIEGKK